jgi:hypothetical protein
MFYEDIIKKSIHYYDTSIVALILSVVTIPSLWYVSQGNILWVGSCFILWTLGVFIIFHPVIRYIFPILLTNIGVVLLSFILAVLSISLNTLLITTLLPLENIEILVNKIFFSTSIGNIVFFVWFYILVAVTSTLNININLRLLRYRQKKMIQQITNNPLLRTDLFAEVLFLFMLPVALLFWIEITYSFRVLLGLISIGIGVGIFVPKLLMEGIQKKLLVGAISVGAVVAINSMVVHLFGEERIPAAQTIANLQAQNSQDAEFLLSDSQQSNQTEVYQIMLSIPQINLNLGHRIATIQKKEVKIEVTKSQYTLHDQYNNKVLLTLDR